VIAYHPYGGDTFALLPDDSIRCSQYQHTAGIPALAIDGRQVSVPDQINEYDSTFSGYIQVAMSDSSFFDLRLRGTANPVQCSVFVTGVKLDDSPLNADLRLHAIVTEDSLVVMPMGGQQDRVPRCYLPDVSGKPFLLAARLDSLTDTLVFSPGNFRLDKLSVAAFVEDASNHRIQQAAELRRFF
jgi:hypothetical protein